MAEKGEGEASNGDAENGEEAGAASNPKPSCASGTWNGDSGLRRSGSFPDFGAGTSLATAKGEDGLEDAVNGLFSGAGANGLAGAAEES